MKKTIMGLLLVAAIVSCKKTTPGKITTDELNLFTETDYQLKTNVDVPSDAAWLVDGEEMSRGPEGTVRFKETGRAIVDLVTKPGKMGEKSLAHSFMRVVSIYRSLGDDISYTYTSDSTTTNNTIWQYGSIRKVGERKLSVLLWSYYNDVWYFEVNLDEAQKASFDTQITYEYVSPVQVSGTMNAKGTLTRKDGITCIDMVTDEGPYREYFYSSVY